MVAIEIEEHGIISLNSNLNTRVTLNGKGRHLLVEKTEALQRLVPLIGSKIFFIEGTENGAFNGTRGFELNYCSNPRLSAPEITGVDLVVDGRVR